MLLEKSLFQNYKMVSENEKIWYFASEKSYLIEVDKESGEATILLDLSKEDNRVYRTIAKKDNFFYIFSSDGEKVCIFNELDKSLTFRDIRINYPRKLNWASNQVQIGDECYFFWQSSPIIKYNIVSEEIKILDGIDDFLPKEFNPIHWYARDAIKKGEYLIFHIKESAHLLYLNTINEEFKLQELYIPEYVDEVIEVFWGKQSFWAICRKDTNKLAVYQCKDINNKISNKICEIQATIKDNFLFHCEVGANYLWLIPTKNDKGFKIDLNTFEVKEIDEISYTPMNKRLPYGVSSYDYHSWTFSEDGKWITIHAYTGKLVEIDLTKDEIRERKIFFDEESHSKLFINNSGQFFFEKDGNDLEDYLNVIKHNHKKGN